MTHTPLAITAIHRLSLVRAPRPARSIARPHFGPTLGPAVRLPYRPVGRINSQTTAKHNSRKQIRSALLRHLMI
jgi:hypothetical protein